MAQSAVSSSGNHVLRTIDEVPEPYNNVFAKYSYFNAIQSTVFNEVFYSDDSIAVSAPTGSGKTALFELAIVRLLMSLDNSDYKQDYKIIYVAPMKAICEERLVDWHQKFSNFGVQSISVTGDTELIDYQCLKSCNIVITTPEKWDSVTRNWRDNEKLIRSVRLFMVDEIHLLNDETRGSVLEAAITRMKTIDRSVKENPLRFIAVSATVSNIEDVALWFGKTQVPAKHFKFEDSMRPVQLQKRVLGYPYNPKLSSPFKFDIMLSYKLHHILLQYSAGKPTLVFCSTRKSVEMTSKQLIQNLTINLTPQQKSVLGEACREIKNSNIVDTLIHGVGSHHAGMLPEHRRLIENLFRETSLPVLVTTSTLAMGVNLPAQLVVVKSTKYYSNGEFKDYSATMISQMIGRAGRPQFDTSGTAVIMTTTGDKHKYENMVSGEQPIESYLRKHLVEFVNAEVVLRTITDLSVAMQWLSSTFLYIRARKNPRHYGLPINLSPTQLDKKLLEMCQIEINKLNRAGMLTIDTNITILPTEIGRLMARNCISFETMKLFTQVTGTETLQQILGLISKCNEFQEIRLRSNDKSTLNLLNKCRNKQTIRFTLNGKIRTLDMKINCIIQAVLGCLEIVESWLLVEAQKIMRTGERLLLCLAEYLETRVCCYQALLNSIILSKCFHARIWENSEYVSRQLEGIGVTFSNALVESGKTTFKDLLEANPRDLERITKRKPPFGNNIQDQVRLIPMYQLSVQTMEIGKNISIAIDISVENGSEFNGQMTGNPYGIMHLLVGDSENNILFHKKYNHLCLVENLNTTQNIEVEFGEEREVFINFISQEWVGIDCTEKLVLFPDLTKPKPTKQDAGVSKIAARACKLVKRKSPQQQTMNKYFKNVKPIPKKKSNEKLSQPKTIEPQNEDDSIIDSSQIPDTPTTSAENPQDDRLSNILRHSMKGILKVVNKRNITENANTDIDTVIRNLSSETNPISKAVETNTVVSSADFLRNHPAVVKYNSKPKPARSSKREVLAKRREFMNSTRALELEASLYDDPIIDLSEFAKTDKKKITNDEKPPEANKTITWKSPVVEQLLVKHSPNLPRQAAQKEVEANRPTLNKRNPMFPLSDKDWSYNPKKYSDVLSKSLIETLEPEKMQSLEDFMSQTALSVFGVEDKSEKQDLNATISSSSSLPVSVKTKIADSTNSYFSEVECNSFAEKIKKAVPAINDEMGKEELKKPDDDEDPKEQIVDENVEPEVKPQETNKSLKRRYSWEEEFLANDPMVEFTEDVTPNPRNDDGFKKFKELEEAIVKQPNYKPSPIYQETTPKQLTKQTLLHKKPKFDLIDERLDPDQCLGFASLEETDLNLPDYDAMEKSNIEYLASRHRMEEASNMEEGYVSRSLPQYGSRLGYVQMPRHQIEDAREGMMDFHYPQRRRSSFGERIPQEVDYNRYNPRESDDMAFGQQPYAMERYPKPIPQYHASNYVSYVGAPSFPNSYSQLNQNIMKSTPVKPYNDYLRNEDMPQYPSQPQYNPYQNQYPQPSNKIDYPYHQHFDNRNSYERLRPENTYAPTPYGYQNPRSQRVLAPLNRIDHNIHHGPQNLRNDQFVDNSYSSSHGLESRQRSLHNFGPQNDTGVYNSGDKKYIMDKFLLSQSCLNLNHTLTSKDIYNDEFNY